MTRPALNQTLRVRPPGRPFKRGPGSQETERAAKGPDRRGRQRERTGDTQSHRSQARYVNIRTVPAGFSDLGFSDQKFGVFGRAPWV